MSSLTSPSTTTSDLFPAPLSPLWIKSENFNNMDIPNSPSMLTCNGIPNIERTAKLSFTKPLTPVNGTGRRLSMQWPTGAPPSPCAQDYLDSTSGRRGSRRCSISLLRGLMGGFNADTYSNDHNMSSSEFGISYSYANKEDVLPSEPPTPLTVTTTRHLTLPDPTTAASAIGIDASGGEPDIFSDYGSASEKSDSNTPRNGSAVLPPDDPLEFLPQLFPNFFTQLEAAVTEGINVAAATGVPPTSPQVRRHALSTSQIPRPEVQVALSSVPIRRVVMPAPQQSVGICLTQRRPKKRARSCPSSAASSVASSRRSSAELSDTGRPAELGQKKCTYCNKTFLCESKLQRHLRTHTGEKPFACICEQTFTQKSSLKTHIMRHAAMKHKKGYVGKKHAPKKMKETGHTMA